MRVEQEGRPSDRTVLVCNVPPWCEVAAVSRIFSKYGPIDTVEAQLKPGNAKNNDCEASELEGRFKVAYIVYKKAISVTALFESANAGDVLYASTVEAPIITGLESFCANYNAAFPNVKQLQDSINAWMAAFEEKQSEGTTEADSEWSRVGKKKAVRLTEDEQKSIKLKAAKKRKKGELLNFYTFQIREGKKKEIVRLREQFEADKKKIDRLRQERKFKPKA